MLEFIKNIGRFARLEYKIRKYGIDRIDDTDSIILKKGKCTFRFVKEKSFYDNHAKLHPAIAYILQNQSNDLSVTESIFESDHGWRAVHFLFGDIDLNMVYHRKIVAQFFFNLYFLQTELPGYLRYYKPKKGDVVVDAGAFHGLFSVLVSKLVGETGTIISVEPDKTNLNILKKNIEINKCNNIIVIEKALWDKKDTLDFSSTGGGESSLFDLTLGVAATKTVAVPKNSIVEAISLPEIIQEYKLKKIDFVKMDIEGAELEAIKGCADIIKKQDMYFAIASYHLRDGKRTFSNLEQLFHGFGYKTKTEYPQHTTTYASKNLGDLPTVYK